MSWNGHEIGPSPRKCSSSNITAAMEPSRNQVSSPFVSHDGWFPHEIANLHAVNQPCDSMYTSDVCNNRSVWLTSNDYDHDLNPDHHYHQQQQQQQLLTITYHHCSPPMNCSLLAAPHTWATGPSEDLHRRDHLYRQQHCVLIPLAHLWRRKIHRWRLFKAGSNKTVTNHEGW